jgi:hypothetical protein
VPIIAVVMLWCIAYVIFLVSSVLCSAVKISPMWREDKMDGRQNSFHFSNSIYVDIYVYMWCMKCIIINKCIKYIGGKKPKPSHRTVILPMPPCSASHIETPPEQRVTGSTTGHPDLPPLEQGSPGQPPASPPPPEQGSSGRLRASLPSC